ncbi:MAG: tetratricopeptide repeat protein, partial [Candidatus Binatia bacterium]
ALPAPDRSPRDRRRFLMAAALVAATAALYAPVGGFGFVPYDDPTYVVDNPRVQAGLSAAGVAWAFGSFHASLWIPLTWLSLMLDATLFGAWAGGYHLTNVLLHGLAAALLFLSLGRMTGALWPSGFVAALFALHPLQVESVAWVTERKDVLSAAGWMATLWCYARYVERPSAGRYAATMLAFALGLLAKPMLVTLPIVLLLLDMWPLSRLPLGSTAAARAALGLLLREKLPFVALALAAGAVTVVAQRAGGAVLPLEALPLSTRVLVGLANYARYLGRLAWPAPLAAFYPYDPAPSAALVAAGAALLVGGTALAIAALRRWPFVTVGWLWFAVTLAPVVGLVQVGEQGWADRFTYIPMIGIGIAVAWSAAAATQRLGWSAALPAAGGAGILLACAWLSAGQIGYWRDGQTLFGHALRVTRDNYMAHFLLASDLVRRGESEAALPHFEAAVALRPRYAAMRNNLGNALIRLGRWREAVAQLRVAVAERPNVPQFRNGLGFALASDGQLEAAAEQYAAALALDPRYAEAAFNLGTLLSDQQRFAEAIPHLTTAARLRPDSRDARRALDAALAATRPAGTGDSGGAGSP